MKKETTPEEKLLNLIRNKKPEAAAEQPPQEERETSVEKIISKTDERISGVLKSDIFKNRFFEPTTLKAVNRYLAVALGVLILYLLIDSIFVRPSKNVKSLIAKMEILGGRYPTRNEKNGAAESKDYSSYSSAISGKAVFGRSQGAGAAQDIAISVGASENMVLVGIIAGDNAQAIIEDKKAQKTYYLNKGDSFNGYVVEEILENKVVLDYEGRKISLFL